MRILVTGHRGYIGSHFFNGLYMKGCDLKDGQDFGNLVDESYDVVVHLAAYVSVVESFQKPDDYFTNNCLNVARFLERNRVGRFIFVSTGGAMYGNKHLANEDDATWDKCVSPYAQSKYVGEMVVRQNIINYAILRLANVYGGNDSVRGEAAAHAHFATDNPIVVYGGNQTRDFVHVDEVCYALRRAVSTDVVGTFNIGTGTESSVKELAEQFSKERGVPIVYKDDRPGEVQYISLNSSRARQAGLL